jgi:hypothetical protein
MKFVYYLLVFIAILIGNQFLLGYKNIKNIRFELNQLCELPGAQVFNCTDVDVNLDDEPDTIEITEMYCFEWLRKYKSVQLLKISDKMIVGLSGPTSKDKSCIKSVIIHKSKRLLLMLIIEQNGNDCRHTLDWKVVGIRNGNFFQRAPTIIEYVSYKLKGEFPAAEVGQ